MKRLSVLLALFIFGIFYNRIVEHIDQRQPGVTSLQVAIGVAATIFGWTQIYEGDKGKDIESLLISFVSSGVPMILGNYMKDIRTH